MGEEEGMKEGKREKEETAEREKEEKKRRSLKSATPKKKTEKVKNTASFASRACADGGWCKGEEERDFSLPSDSSGGGESSELTKTPFTNIISFTNSTSNEAASLPGGELTGSQNG